jgi:hypothetical protein
MSNETIKILDLIPDSLKHQLIMEVFEFLENNKRRHLMSFDKEEPREPVDQKN